MKFASIFLKIILVLSVLIGVGIYSYVQFNKPIYQGELSLLDIRDEVDVYFDKNGVPHIYAENEIDAMKALGFVHAQDRLWQMELIRRIAPGRLSEIFGKEMIETDKYFKTLSIDEASENAVLNLDKKSNEYLLAKSYIDGVNQYVEEGNTPVEFMLLGIEKKRFEIKDVYNVFGYMAFGFAQAQFTDPLLTTLRDKLGEEYIKDLAIDIDPNSATIKNYKKLEVSDPEIDKIDVKNTALAFLNDLPFPKFIGSNSWVVNGNKTKSGKVILVNDPHIGFSQPSVWYQAHIKTPNYEMYGYHLALSPFPLLGHNRDFAYGVTMFENDDIDFFEEMINPNDSLQFLSSRGYKDFKIVKKEIKVKGEENVFIDVKYSDHGPIINDYLGVKSFESSIAMEWVYTKYENELLSACYDISHANSLEEFRNGAKKIHAPGLNFTYGDAIGNIAWFAVGKLFQRKGNEHSKFILNAMNTMNDSIEFYDFKDNPQAINPKWDYTYSANNQPDSIRGALYPGYYLPENRANRIVDLLEEKDDFSKEDMERMVFDTTSTIDADLASILVQSLNKFNDFGQIENQGIIKLSKWEGDYLKRSIAPIIYVKFLYHFLEETFKDEMGEDYFQQFMETHFYKRQIAKSMKLDNSIWFDNVETKEIETKEDILLKSYRITIDELKKQLGDDIETWRWGNVHTTYHDHPFSKIGKIGEKLFSVGPFSSDGGNELINNQIFDLNPEGIYVSKAGPSTRRVIDFSDIEHSSTILPTGQSGNLFSLYYKNQADKFI